MWSVSQRTCAVGFAMLTALASGFAAGRDAHGQARTPPTVPERLSNADVMRFVSAQRTAIQACTAQQRREQPGRAGRVVMRFAIQPAGTTTGVTVLSADTRTTVMAACMSRLIRSWTFPAHRLQGPPVELPFTF